MFVTIQYPRVHQKKIVKNIFVKKVVNLFVLIVIDYGLKWKDLRPVNVLMIIRC